MSSSDAIKEYIVDYCNQCFKLKSKRSDWKRISKKTITIPSPYGSGSVDTHTVREFQNSKLGLEFIVVGEDEAECIMEKGPMYYSIWTNHEMDAALGAIAFCSEYFWNKCGHIPDQHIASIMHCLGVDPGFGEMMENCFELPEGWTIQMAREHFNALGFTEKPEMIK